MSGWLTDAMNHTAASSVSATATLQPIQGRIAFHGARFHSARVTLV